MIVVNGVLCLKRRHNTSEILLYLRAFIGLIAITLWLIFISLNLSYNENYSVNYMSWIVAFIPLYVEIVQWWMSCIFLEKYHPTNID